MPGCLRRPSRCIFIVSFWFDANLRAHFPRVAPLLQMRFKKNIDGQPQFLDVTDPDFIVWMRTAALPNFRKLYRIINETLAPGVYTFTVANSPSPAYPHMHSQTFA